MKKLKRKTKWMGLLLSFCMVLSMEPLTAFAEEAESTKQGSMVEHILNENNNWDISDELIMPGESFCIEPKYECTTSKVQSGVLEFAAVPILSHVSLLLSHPDSVSNSDLDDGKARWYTNKLVRSTADTTNIVPCKTNTYNVIKTAYEKGDLDNALAQNPQDAEHQAALQTALQSALSGETTVNAGYVNNTGLPFVLEQVRGGSTQFNGTIKGGKYGETILVDASSTHNWGCTIRFYEPYYTLSYNGLQEEEEKGLPDRYYIQNEKQELVMAVPIRPGKHLVQWDGLPFAEQKKVGGAVVLSFNWDDICNAGYNFGDETLSPVFEDGFTVTFNPNGGTIEDKETDIHELDTTSETFFDIGAYVPKRDGYTFLGWCSYPSADDDSLIKNTKNYDWVDKWVADWNNSLVEKKYDIQLYAKWEKTDPCANGHKTQKTVAKATVSSDGKIVTNCPVCNEILSTEVIPKASDISLSATSYTYNGKVKKPSVTVKDDTGKKVSSAYYTVSYAKGCKKVGTYTVTVKFKGNYSGTVGKTFTIKPKSTSISKLTAGRKKFTVKWKKQATQTTGYQVQYSTSSKFKNAKTVTVSKNKTTGKTVSKLKAKKKYYVRIRTYKRIKAGGKSTKLYSSWSKAKTVKVK